jgi:histidyl-tRNA synthetase
MLSIIQNIFAILDLPQITFRISNRKILAGLLEEYQVQDQVGVLRVIDKYEKLSKEDWIQAIQELQIPEPQTDTLYNLVSANKSNQEILDLLNSLDCQNALFQEGIQALQELIKYLDLFQINSYRIDLSIVRGQDYYTGTVFESNLEELESFGSICSGGRYDNLVGNYIDTPITGFGASIGVSRLFGILREENWFQEMNYTEDKRGVFILSEQNLSENMQAILELRDEYGVAFDLYPEIVSFKKALQYANRKHYTEAIFFGSDEAKLGEVLIKNMQTGEQKIVALQDIEV